jgi:hypothetical protein
VGGGLLINPVKKWAEVKIHEKNVCYNGGRFPKGASYQK